MTDFIFGVVVICMLAICIGVILDAGGDEGTKADQLQDVDGDKP